MTKRRAELVARNERAHRNQAYWDVWRYAETLHDFVRQASGLMRSWNEQGTAGAERSLPQSVQGELDNWWEDVEWLKTRKN